MRHPRTNTGKEVITDTVFSLLFLKTWSSCWQKGWKISVELLWSSCSPYAGWNVMTYLGLSAALGKIGVNSAVEAGWFLTHQEKQQLLFKTQLSHFQIKPWDPQQRRRNGRARLVLAKHHRFQCPSMAVGSIVLLQLFLLVNQMFSFTILAKIQHGELHFLSLPSLHSTASARGVFPSPYSWCSYCRAGATCHPRASGISTAGEKLFFSLPDSKSHGPYCVSIRHYYLHFPHGITLWNLLLLFGAQIETLWPCMNTKPA